MGPANSLTQMSGKHSHYLWVLTWSSMLWCSGEGGRLEATTIPQQLGNLLVAMQPEKSPGSYPASLTSPHLFPRLGNNFNTYTVGQSASIYGLSAGHKAISLLLT